MAAFDDALILDAPGALVLALVLSLGFLAALVSAGTEKPLRRYYGFLLAFGATMSVAALADNLGILWASVEATTLASALLVGHHGTKQATEAAWKYLVLSSAGIMIAFVATLLLVAAAIGTGEATLSAVELGRRGHRLDRELVRAVFVLVVIGYGTKAGLVPMHFWLADAHSQAPSPVSALLSGVLLSCALLAVDRVRRVAIAAGGDVPWLLLGFAALTVVVGGLLVFGARDYKRLLAHSSVENMGLAAFALGIGTPIAVAGAYLHIVAHGVAKALAFFSAGRIQHHTGTREIARTKDLLRRAPVAGGGLLLGFVALAGVPLFAPFVSKVVIVSAAVRTAPWGATVPVLVGLVLAFLGFARHAAVMFPAEGAASERFTEPWHVLAALVVLATVTVALGIGAFALVGGPLAAAGGGP